MQLFPRRTADLRRYKFINWKVVVIEHVEHMFLAVAAQAAAVGHFERLYVSKDTLNSSIQLFFGQHPVGVVPGGKDTAIERGAALVISQGLTGAIAVFLYPYKSEISCRQEKLIVWGVFDNPLELTERVLKSAIADFTRYARVSSVFDGGTSADRRRVNRLLRRDQFQSEAKVDAVKQTEEDARVRKEELADKARARKEKPSSWGARLASWWPLGLVATFITIVGGLDPFFVQLRKWSAPIFGQVPDTTMPVITGWYTFCPQDDSGASPRLLNLLYDIGQNTGKVSFFDVQIQVDCVMGTTFDPFEPIARTSDEHSLTYHFASSSTDRAKVDGGRDSANLGRLLPDNGTSVRVFDDRDGRNALSRLGINIEGLEDQLYGPYQIKERGDDASLSLELSAPTLDTAMHAAASVIAKQLRVKHETATPPRRLPQPISISEEDLRRFNELSLPSATPSAPLPSAPLPLPPLDAKSLSKLPPPPPSANTEPKLLAK